MEAFQHRTHKCWTPASHDSDNEWATVNKKWTKTKSKIQVIVRDFFVPDKTHAKSNLPNSAVVVFYAKSHANQFVMSPHDKPVVIKSVVISTLFAI